MKKILYSFLAIIVFFNTTIAQFKKTAGGFAFEAKASIFLNDYDLVGGGVVLKAVATPYDEQYFVDFLDVRILDASTGHSRLSFVTSDGQISFSAADYLVRDAAMLVGNENPDSLVRDVSLLGLPARDEKNTYPTDKYFHVEMNKALIGTKSGETLLLVDILMTDIDQYADTIQGARACRKFQRTYDSLLMVSLLNLELAYREISPASQLEYALTSEYVRIFFQLKYGLINKVDALSALLGIVRPSNWTYNDRWRECTYRVSADSVLVLEGTPVFTFLTGNMRNDLFTDFFAENPQLITILRSDTFKDAEQFGRIAAFFRLLREDYPVIWRKVYDHYNSDEFSLNHERYRGNTPRIIER